MTKLRVTSAIATMCLLTACGGGGGGGGEVAASTSFNYGPTPAQNQTLAQIQATPGQYIDTGGDGQSIRAATTNDDVRVNSSIRRVYGFRTTGTDDQFEVRVNTRIFPAVTLQDRAFVQTQSGGDTLDLYSIGDQATPTTGGTQSVISGLWILQPDGANLRLIGGFRAGSFTAASDVDTIRAGAVDVTYAGVDTAVIRFESETETPFTALGDVNMRFNFSTDATLTGQIINLEQIGGPLKLEDIQFEGVVSGNTWSANITGLADPASGPANLQRLTEAEVTNANRNSMSGAFYGPNADQTAGTLRANDNAERYITGSFQANRN